MLILSFTVHEVLPIQSKKVIAFLLAKIHLNPGYLILGYKERGCGFPTKILMKRGSSYTGATSQIPPDKAPRPLIKNEQTNTGLQEL